MHKYAIVKVAGIVHTLAVLGKVFLTYPRISSLWHIYNIITYIEFCNFTH